MRDSSDRGSPFGLHDSAVNDGPFGINQEDPDQGAQEHHSCTHQEWRDPQAAVEQTSIHNGGGRSAKGTDHVHHARDRAAKLAAYVHGDGPGRADYPFEKEERGGQTKNRAECVRGQRGGNYERACQNKAGSSHDAARQFGVARVFEDDIGERAANYVSGHPRKKRNRSPNAQGTNGHVEMLSQIGRIPGEVEVRSKEEAEIAERDEPHVGREEDLFPGSGELRDGRRFYGSVLVDASDAGQFGAIDASVILGNIAVEKGESNRPHNAQRAEDVKNRAPTEGEQNAARNEWSDRNGEAAEEMRRALDTAAFDARKPELHAAAGDRKCPGFAQSQKKARAEERTEAAGRAGHHGGGGPQRHDDREHALGAKAVTKPARGNLSERIGPRKGGEDEAHSAFAETKLVGDFRLRNRDIAAVHVTDQVHQAD